MAGAGDADLAGESFQPHAGGEIRVEHLHCDLRVMAEIAGQVHDGHTATTDLVLYRVAFGEDAAQAAGRIRHVASGEGVIRYMDRRSKTEPGAGEFVRLGKPG